MSHPLELVIVPSARADHYEILAASSKSPSLTSEQVDGVVAIALESGDRVLYDVRQHEQRRAA